MKTFEPKIEMWDIDRVKPYRKNAKRHSSEQVAQLVAAFDAFGFDVPLVVESNGTIIKGHGRYIGLKSQNRKRVPVIVRDDLSPDEVKAARLSDNRLAESPWDHDLRSSEMIELYEADFPIDIIGFTPDEVAFMFGIDLEPEQDATAEAENDGKHKLTLEFNTRDEQQAMLAEMQGRGITCKAQGK
jgi:ParB-like chromosome segregation protein Spo0J